ncbi:hypothetical protein pb186bvf_011331 [Paramecium bursaria]
MIEIILPQNEEFNIVNFKLRFLSILNESQFKSLQFNLICPYLMINVFILLSLRCLEFKLIGSTTLKSNNVIELDDRNQTYTMWFQIRHIVFQQMSLINPVFPLVITDQFNNIQFLVKITQENQFIKITFIGENKNEENFSKLLIQDVETEWIKFYMQREICFNRIVGLNIDGIWTCSQSFQATLFLTSTTQIKILIYDSNQFENEYVVSRLQFYDNFFVLDVYKDQLEIHAYVKFYCYSKVDKIIFEVYNEKVLICISLLQEVISIYVMNYQNYKRYTVNQIQIECEQWNHFSLSFQGTKIILQFYINGQQYKEIITLEDYQIKYTQFEYKTHTYLKNYNSIATFSKLLVIHKIQDKTDQNFEFCNPQCLKCEQFQCLQYCKNGELFDETQQTCLNLTNSTFYNFFLDQEINSENQIIKCQNCKISYDLTQCRFYENEYDNIDLVCQFQELLFQDIINQLGLKENIPQIFQYVPLRLMSAKHFAYETDLELITLKNRDIHMIYYDSNQLLLYCQNGYHDKQICKKNTKQCWFQNKNCTLCHQNYSFFKNKCVKCQLNCLACKVINKIIKCILFADNYFLDYKGLVKKCNYQLNMLICQDKDVVIQHLLNNENKVCQHQIYSIENDQCLDLDGYVIDYNILEYPNYISLAQQKLEVQDMILIQNIQQYQNQEIKFLINLQQTLKIIQQLQDQKFLQYKQNAERQAQYLHLLGIQEEDFKLQKIILNVKIFLGLYIEYQNQKFKELIEIYQNLNLTSFKYIQFNLVIMPKFPSIGQTLQYTVQPEIYRYGINYQNYPDSTFIFNISFQLSPKTLFSECNSYYFNANKVILNNLTFINQSFVSQCNEEGEFMIRAEEIIIQNIYLWRLEFENLFYLENFKILKILDIQIYESKLKLFINAKSFKKHHFQTMQIKNISIFNSEVWQFIYCEDIQYAKIINLNIYQSKLEGLFIQMNGDIREIIVSDLLLVEVEYSISMLFQLESTLINNQKFLKSVLIQDVYLISNIINESIIFQLQEIDHVKLNHIYISNSTFQTGDFIQFNKQYLFIDNLQISAIMINSNFIMFQGLAIEMYKIYIQINYSESSSIFNFYTGNVYIYNIYFLIYKLHNTALLDINCQEVIFNQIMIMKSIIQNCPRFIEIQSLSYIHILNIRFQNLQIIDSVMLISNAYMQLTLEKLSIINVTIITQQIKQLMQFHFGRKILNELLLMNINVTSQVDQYIFMKFNNQPMIEFNRLKIINLQNLQPQLFVYLIKNEFSHIKINKIFAINILNVRFMTSESTSFRIIDGQLSYIEISDQHFPLIVSWQLKIQSRNDLVIINNLKLNNFRSSFIQVTGSGVMVHFKNIHFKDSVFENNTFQVNGIQFLSIYNFKIFNKNPLQSTKTFLFLIKSQLLFINQVKINNINQQFLFLADFKICNIKNVDISNIQSNKFIDLRSNISRGVVIYNVFIYNSFSEIDSLFSLMGTYDSIIIRKIIILNIKVKNEIFSFNFQNQSKSQISYIIINNVTSQNRLFYCSSNINYHNIQIIKTSQLIIFQNYGTIMLNYALITNVSHQSKLSDSPMTINGSEIVNSNLTQDEQKLKLKQSIFEGNFNQQDQIIKIYISLNSGGQMFKYKSLTESLFQVQFNNANDFLYLPSGRDISSYRYFSTYTQQYQYLYESISFINIYQGQQIMCILSQSIDNYTIVQKHINVNPGVNIADNLIFTLNPNYKDKHIQMDLNCSQNQQYITYRTLVKTFNCQLGEYLFKEQCLECNIEQQLYSVGYNQEYCLYKDSNKIQDLKLGQIKLHQQFWRYSYANKYIEQCPNENCLGGWQTGDQSCQIGYIGGICQECDIDNIRGDGNYGKIDNQCYVCYFDQKIYFKGLLLIVYQLLLVCISYYSNKQQSEQYLFLRISQRKFTDLLQRQNVDQVTILLKLYYNYLFTIFILKDLFNFGYIISISLNFIYNPNITAVPQFDCLINSAVPTPIQYTQLLYKIIIPLVLFNISQNLDILSTAYTSSLLVYIRYISKTKQLSYKGIFIEIQQSLIKLSSKVRYSNIYWTLENLAVQYYSQVHLYYMYVLILPLICIFTLIFITLIQIINQRIFNKLKLSLLIFKQYKQQFTFWDQIRTLFIYLFMLAYYSLSENYTILLALTFVTITLIQPFQLSNLNKIDLYIQSFSLYSYFAMLISQEKDQYLSYFAFILSNSILLKIYLKYLQHGFNIQYKKLKLKTSNLIYKRIYYKKYVTNMDKQNKIIYYFKLVKQNRKKSIKLDQAIFETNSAHQVQELKSQTNIEIEMAPIHYIQISQSPWAVILRVSQNRINSIQISQFINKEILIIKQEQNSHRLIIFQGFSKKQQLFYGLDYNSRAKACLLY